MKKVWDFLKNFVIIAYILIIIFVTICLLSYNKYKVTVFGKNTFLPVIDEDLEPDYKYGDLLIINRNNLSSVKEGDVIFFYRTVAGITNVNYATVVRNERVTDTETTFTIEGGYTFSSSYFIGKADTTTIIPKLGRIIGLLESRWGFLFLGVLPSLLAFLFTIRSVVAEIRNDDEDNDENDSKTIAKKKKKDKKEKEEIMDNTNNIESEKKTEKEDEAIKFLDKKEDVSENSIVSKDNLIKENDINKIKSEDINDSNPLNNENNGEENKNEESKNIEENKESENNENTQKNNSTDQIDDNNKMQENADTKKDEKNNLKTMTEEEKKALIQAKINSMTEEQKKALIQAKLNSMTEEQKRALIEAKKKKMESDNK